MTIEDYKKESGAIQQALNDYNIKLENLKLQYVIDIFKFNVGDIITEEINGISMAINGISVYEYGNKGPLPTYYGKVLKADGKPGKRTYRMSITIIDDKPHVI